MPQKKARRLDEKEIGQLETMGALRLPLDHCAAILGMSKVTLERCMKKNPAARDALERGKANASANIRQRAYEQAMAGNTTMLIFWLKTQEGWRENDRLEISGDGGGPVRTIRELNPQQRQKKLDKYKAMLELTDGE